MEIVDGAGSSTPGAQISASLLAGARQTCLEFVQMRSLRCPKEWMQIPCESDFDFKPAACARGIPDLLCMRPTKSFTRTCSAFMFFSRKEGRKRPIDLSAKFDQSSIV